MTLKPTWARDVAPELWAPHVISRTTGDLPTDIEYLMFFNARFKEDRKKDKHKDQHCIGVARAGSPKGQFVPRSKPLLCPPKINLKDHRQDYDEVLDPSIYTEAGKTYLVYKLGDNQAGVKSEGGKDVNYGAVRYSIEARQLDLATMELADVPPLVLLSEGKTRGFNAEAPDLVRAGGRTHLFVSRNYWRTNDYQTESWSAPSIVEFASSVARQVEGLGDSEAPGLSGPGGAEVIKVGNTLKIAFHSHITEPPEPRGTGPLQRVAYTGDLNRVGDSFSLAEPATE